MSYSVSSVSSVWFQLLCLTIVISLCQDSLPSRKGTLCHWCSRLFRVICLACVLASSAYSVPVPVYPVSLVLSPRLPTQPTSYIFYSRVLVSKWYLVSPYACVLHLYCQLINIREMRIRFYTWFTHCNYFKYNYSLHHK